MSIFYPSEHRCPNRAHMLNEILQSLCVLYAVDSSPKSTTDHPQ